MTLPHISDAILAEDSSESDRKIRVRSVWTSVRQASVPDSTERSEEIDCVATIGMQRHCRRQRERLLVAGRIVLAHGGERLILVADEHGGPEVAAGLAGGLGRPPEQRLYPGILQEHADGASERRVRVRGHVEGEDPAPFDQLGERREPAAKARHGPDGCAVLVRSRTIHMYGFVRVRRRRTEHARDLRLIEQREEDRDALDDGGAELGIERHPVVQVPALDRLHLLPELAACAALAFLGLERDAEFREPIPQPGIEPAGGLLGAGHRLPGPFPEGFLVSGEILGRDDGPHRAEPVGQLAGLADLPAEQLRVDRAAVDVLQRDPAPGQEPVQFDDPASAFGFGSVVIIELTRFAGRIPAKRFPPNGVRSELSGGLRAPP